MMKSLRYEKFAGFSIPRILFFGIMGIVLLAIPSFAVNGAFYAVVGYLVLAGIFGITDVIRCKDEKHLLDYASVAICVILILFGIGSMVFARYLVNVSPLYLGALFLIEGAYYFSVTPCGTGALRRSLLIILSMTVFFGGIGVIVFTFGFGVDGLSGLARISGVAAILSCVYALAAYLFYQKNAVLHLGSEERV